MGNRNRFDFDETNAVTNKQEITISELLYLKCILNFILISNPHKTISNDNFSCNLLQILF